MERATLPYCKGDFIRMHGLISEVKDKYIYILSRDRRSCLKYKRLNHSWENLQSHHFCDLEVYRFQNEEDVKNLAKFHEDIDYYTDQYNFVMNNEVKHPEYECFQIGDYLYFDGQYMRILDKDEQSYFIESAIIFPIVLYRKGNITFPNCKDFKKYNNISKCEEIIKYAKSTINNAKRFGENKNFCY